MPSKRSSTKRSLDFDDKNDDDAKNVVDLTESSPTTTPAKKKQKSMDDFFSSPAKTKESSKTAAAIVTPADEKAHEKEEETFKAKKSLGENLAGEIKSDEGDDSEEDFAEDPDAYNPTYLHKNIEYYRKGESELDDNTRKVFRFVTNHYQIPPNFENDRKYGPKSGVSFEQRLIASYSNSLLKPKGDTRQLICTSCASRGHVRDECPELL